MSEENSRKENEDVNMLEKETSNNQISQNQESLAKNSEVISNQIQASLTANAPQNQENVAKISNQNQGIEASQIAAPVAGHPQPELRMLFLQEHIRKRGRITETKDSSFYHKLKLEEEDLKAEAESQKIIKKIYSIRPRIPEHVARPSMKNPLVNLVSSVPLETEEDIEKFYEERRKNFPSKRRILEKKIKECERLARGEIIVSKLEAPRTDLSDDPAKQKKTLLEKLLDKDINSEKTIILQCFNYFVKNKFFCEGKDLKPEILKSVNKINQVQSEKFTQYMKRVEELKKELESTNEEEKAFQAQIETSKSESNFQATEEAQIETSKSELKSKNDEELKNN